MHYTPPSPTRPTQLIDCAVFRTKPGRTLAHTGLFLHDVRRTFLLALPVILGQVATMATGFVDTVMAGRLGPLALASVAIGSAIWSAGLLFLLGTLMSLSALVSQLHGAGRILAIGRLLRQAYWLAAVLAGLFWLYLQGASPIIQWLGVDPAIHPLARGYLDGIAWGTPALAGFFVLRFFCEGMSVTRATFYFGLLALVVNVPANYVFMYGKLGLPAMGAPGIGMATAFVEWVQLLAILLYVRRQPELRATGLLGFSRPRWPRIRQLLQVGLPIGFMVFFEGSLFVAVSLLMGTLGPLVVAAHQVAINYSSMVFMIPMGLGSALTVRVGNAVGRGDFQGVRRAGGVGLVLVLTTQLLSAGVMLAFPAQIARIYTDDAQVIDLVVQLLWLAALFQLPDGLQVAAAGALRGLKDTRVPMLINVVAYWLIGMPLAWWLGFRAELGARGLWMGLIAGLSVAAVLLLWRFHRLSRRLLQPARDTAATARLQG